MTLASNSSFTFSNEISTIVQITLNEPVGHQHWCVPQNNNVAQGWPGWLKGSIWGRNKVEYISWCFLSFAWGIPHQGRVQMVRSQRKGQLQQLLSPAKILGFWVQIIPASKRYFFPLPGLFPLRPGNFSASNFFSFQGIFPLPPLTGPLSFVSLSHLHNGLRPNLKDLYSGSLCWYWTFYWLNKQLRKIFKRLVLRPKGVRHSRTSMRSALGKILDFGSWESFPKAFFHLHLFFSLSLSFTESWWGGFYCILRSWLCTV